MGMVELERSSVVSGKGRRGGWVWRYESEFVGGGVRCDMCVCVGVGVVVWGSV